MISCLKFLKEVNKYQQSKETERQNTQTLHCTKIYFSLLKVDVIVNLCSHDMELSNGAVSKSILQAAGQSIQNEVKKVPYVVFALC